MTSFVKAAKALEKDRVWVTMETVRPRKAQAPTGKGLKTRPAMVERNMQSNCQDWGVTSGGLGMRKRTMRPMEIEIMNGRGLAPWEGGGGGSVNSEEGEGRLGKLEEEEARIDGRREGFVVAGKREKDWRVGIE